MCSVGRPCSVCVVCGPVVGPIDLVLIIRFHERSTAESGGLGERHSSLLGIWGLIAVRLSHEAVQ